MNDTIRCSKCKTILVFYGFRGLNVVNYCPQCKEIQVERHVYQGLEEDLNGSVGLGNCQG